MRSVIARWLTSLARAVCDHPQPWDRDEWGPVCGACGADPFPPD